MTRFSVFAVCVGMLPAPAFAGAWDAPEGCEIFLTVQAKACRVSNHYRCSGDDPGDQWRADFDQEGLFFQSRINFDAEWVESFEPGSGVTQTIDAGSPDPMNFSALLANGRDDFDFGLSRDDGSSSAVTGFDRLTGETATIDDVALEVTEFSYTEVDSAGNMLNRARGNEYISREMRMFFAGPGQTDLGDGMWREIDGRPVQFIFPGEPGFAAKQPLFDCDAIMSMAPTERVTHVSY
jgi:hypothetical protein